MRAAFYSRAGAAHEVLELGEQPTPTPGPGEVRVRLRTSGVNPSDWKKRRRGEFTGQLEASPIIPHSDGAGDIDAVGEGVIDRTGERVWIWNGQWQRRQGTAAEYIVVPGAQAVTLPDNVDYAAGACLGIPAMTAMQAVRLAQAGPGMTVLVVGGAGAVGHYSVQFAKGRGARVLATVSSDEKALHARRGGADEVINYRAEDVGARVRELTEGRGVDALIDMDLSVNAPNYPAILARHARVVAYGMSADQPTLPARWLMQNSITLDLFLVYDIDPGDRRLIIAELDGVLRRGDVLHTVARRLPLEAIADAHDLVERGEVLGNVVLDINGSA